jgi:hypothetical protein
MSDEERKNDPTFGVRDATDLSWWNIAVRNAGHNLFSRPMPEYRTKTNTADETLEALPGFQWRYRESLDGEYVSFRMTWGKPDKSKGKNEFYIGWVMNETEYMRLSFFQLRPAWLALIPIVVLVVLL